MVVLQKVSGVANGPDLRFLELALMGRKVNFSKVFKMIDEMAAILKQEQIDDDAKKEYCRTQLDQAKDKGKATKGAIEDPESSIDDNTAALATHKDELKTF